MSGYVLTTEEVLGMLGSYLHEYGAECDMNLPGNSPDEIVDRWLATHDAEVTAKALKARQPSENAREAAEAEADRRFPWTGRWVPNLTVQDRRIGFREGAEWAFSRAAVPDAATEAKQPEGWSTEDRQESKQEAERRWVDERSGYKSDYNRGCINGFILGAEWQKARDTFISYKAIADEARAERDAALAAIERIRVIHERDMVLRDYCSECSDFGSDQFPPGQMVEWPCPTVAALDEAPEPEEKP